MSETTQLREARASGTGAGRSALPWLVIVLVAGAAARGAVLPHSTYPSFDGTWWLALARNLAAFGHYGSGEVAPGFPSVLAGLLVFVGWEHPMAPLRIAQAVNSPLSLVQAGLAFVLVRRYFGSFPALVCAVILVALPLSIRAAVGDGFELLLGCVLLAAWLALESNRPVVAGALLAAASLLGPPGLLFLVAAPLVHRGRSSLGFVRIFGTAAVVLVVAVALGKLSGSGIERGLWGSWTWIPEDGFSGWLRWLGRLVDMLPRQIGWPGVALAVVGAIAYGGRWLVLLLPLMALPMMPYAPEPLAWIGFLPALMIAALFGLRLIKSILFEFGHARRGAQIALALALLGLGWASSSLYPRILVRDPFQPGLMEAGLWLRGEVQRSTLITAPLPYVSYWAWCRHAPFPAGIGATPGIERASRFGAEVLVVDAGVAATRYPELLPLVEGVPPHLKARLEPLAAFGIEGEPEQAVYLYTILPP